MVETTRKQAHKPQRPWRKRRAAPGRDRQPSPPARYDRQTDLPRVLPLWPHELNDLSAAGRARILGKLRRALRAERQRGICGHWTYDLARHAELVRVYRLELAASGLRDVRRA